MITKGTYYILGNGITFKEDEIEILPYLKIRNVG